LLPQVFSDSFLGTRGIIMKFIYHPNVHIIASSAVDTDQILEWAIEHDMGDVARKDTPLSAIINRGSVSRGEYGHLEKLVEFAGRHCYRSWSKGRGTEEYIKNIIEQNHGSVMEHANVTFAISGVSRSLTHELVRHRVGVAISQESQRYVDAESINFVIPPIMVWENIAEEIDCFKDDCNKSLQRYKDLQRHLNCITAPATLSPTITKKRANEASRGLLPNAAETRLTWTANIRTLRHFFEVRGSLHADHEIRRLAVELCLMCKAKWPAFFYDLEVRSIPATESDIRDCGVPHITKVV
jgi:thymidylate synthase (FAD)